MVDSLIIDLCVVRPVTALAGIAIATGFKFGKTDEAQLPPPRPQLWPLRAAETASTTFETCPDGCRRILIKHAILKHVTPEMLAWWYRHVSGDMAYAGSRLPRYLVWHPLDHISCRIVKPAGATTAGAGTRVHIREAFQRDPQKLLDVRVTVEQIDTDAAIIGNRIVGLCALRPVISTCPKRHKLLRS